MTSREISCHTAGVARSRSAEGDHIDSWLEEIGSRLPESVDLEIEAIVDRIHGLDWRIRKMLAETLEEFGLTASDWKVLTSLRWTEPELWTAGRLARRADLTSGTMTARLDHLEGQGLVRRLRAPDDRRSVLVELTDKGRQTLAKAMGVQAEREKILTEALTPKEMEQLNRLLRRVMASVEKRIPHP